MWKVSVSCMLGKCLTTGSLGGKRPWSMLCQFPCCQCFCQCRIWATEWHRQVQSGKEMYTSALENAQLSMVLDPGSHPSWGFWILIWSSIMSVHYLSWAPSDLSRCCVERGRIGADSRVSGTRLEPSWWTSPSRLAHRGPTTHTVI